MVLDDERQRDIILTLINSATFPGTMLDEMAAFRATVAKAEVREPPAEPKEPPK